MSHELRTPLNAVLGFSEVLLERMFGEHQRAPGGVPARHPRLGQAPARAAQRDPRPVQGRGRADGARVLRPWTCRPCSTQPASMVRERAAAHGIELSVEVRGRRRHGVRRRAAAQAGGAQPADERGEVHRRRRVGRACAPCAVARRSTVTVTDTGIGHPRRRTASASSSRSSRAAGAPRARRAPDSGSPCRGGSSSCSAAGCGWTARSGSAARSASRCPVATTAGAMTERPTDAGRRRRRSTWSSIEDDRPSLDLLTRLPGAGVVRGVTAARDGPVRPGRGPPGAARRRRCWTSGCPAWTAGRCSRRSRRTRRRGTSRWSWCRSSTSAPGARRWAPRRTW